MALSERLALLVTLDGRGAVKGFEQVGRAAEKNLGKSTQKIDMLGKSFTTAGVGMIATGAVLAGGLFKMAQASEEAQLSVTKLENSLANNSGLAGATADEFVALSQAIQGKTAADGDNIVAGIAVLAQGKANAAQIKELTPLVVDLARKKGIDEVSAFTLASKAVNGNAGALKRAGIVVDESAFKTDAYGATVEALRSSVGGFAESEGKTFAGSITRLKNELGDLAEGVGVGVVDAFSSMLKVVDPLISSFTGLDPAVQGAAGKVAAFGGAGLLAAGLASTLIGSLIKMRQNFGAVADGIGNVIGSMRKLSLASVGAIAGLAGLVFLVGIEVWNKHAKAVQEDANAIKNLREESELTGKSFEELTRLNLAEAFATPEAMSALKMMGVNLATLGDAATGSGKKYQSFLSDLDDTEKRLVSSLRGTGKEKQIYAASQLISGILETERIALRGTGVESANLAANQEALGVSTDGLTGLTDGLTGGLDAEKTAAQEAADALDTMSNAIRKQFDEVTNSLDAQIGFEDALRKVNDGLKDNGNSYDRLNPKGRENVEMLRNAQSALGDLVAQRFEDTNSVKEATNAGLFAVEMLKEKLRVAGLTEQQIADLIVQYGLVVPEIVTTAVAKTEQASADITALDNQINALTKDTKIIKYSFVAKALMGAGVQFPGAPPVPPANPYGLKPGSIDITGKAHGGPVSGGMPYIVGERGPELFVPNQSGQIIPTGQGTTSSAAGGGNQTIVVKIGDEVVARVVANAMATGSRRGVG